ncbi:choline/ethanolamine kinase-like [Pollicipes pollicipes]|uniref:choline/ethanolamine kinase-like n=1 Tax=Pollicipes pollicipes TaxID=41117 RepID=UPI0018859781|nr:choline/ethanolamine kinase-like [Pollicipes pollicipes]
MSVDVEAVRDRAHGLCRDYLHGAWQLISADDMLIKPISGGLSNVLFLCELPQRQSSLADEPTRVLLRMYGQVQEGSHESITESVIFTLLAERRLGPKLYGIFPGGRLEEFIQASSLSYSELRDPRISQQIAQKMTTVHSLRVPICKEPTFMWQTMKKWIHLVNDYLKDTTSVEHRDKADIIEALRLCVFEDEVDWLKRLFARAPSPVVFCHNDCQEGNILRPNGGRPGQHQLTLIDFEYCSYGYRGFDVANHFCEWLYDYAIDEYPHFSEHPENWPTEQEQLRFIRAYLRHRNNTAEERTPPAENGDEKTYSAEEVEEQRMLDEVKVYCLASHLFWTLWSVVNAHVSAISFGYWEYAFCRLRAYQTQKQLLMKADPRCPKMTDGGKRRPTHIE